ncbi:MAG: diguanylate cyclase [Acidimicrobiaceae bacterium]|nr:diguanylate cyclase [Acidimicrobiaceae bacterium]
MVEAIIDISEAVEIAPRIWWVGSMLPQGRFQSHVYLVEQGDQSVLIDPGSALNVNDVMRKIESVVGLHNVRWIVCSQADIDVVAALPQLVARGLHPEATIVTHWSNESSIVHSGTSLSHWLIEEHHWRLELKDRTLEFRLTPYLPAAGSFSTFDQKSGTLFSSKLFGGFAEDQSLYLGPQDDFSSIRTFHEYYMPSREILTRAVHQVRELTILRIAPQIGHVIPEVLVAPIMEMLEHLECGVFLLTRNDPGLNFLLAANQTIHDVIHTMVREQNFSTVAAYLAGVASKTLSAEYFELWAGGDERWFQFDQSDSFAGHFAQPPDDVVSVLRGWASSTGRRLVLPLTSPKSGKIDGVMVWGFREPRVLSEASMSVLSQIISLVEVGLEREILHRSLDLERTEWHMQAIHDSLTGLYNRVSLEDSFHRLAAFDDRNLSPQMAALLIDIDYFKRVNDMFGHAAGDVVLQRVAKAISQSVRPSDLVFRYGGEEFLVLMSNVDPTTAIKAAERIRGCVANSGVEVPTVSVSVGVALRYPGEVHQPLIARADQALFLAKSNGRDRVEIAL